MRRSASSRSALASHAAIDDERRVVIRRRECYFFCCCALGRTAGNGDRSRFHSTRRTKNSMTWKTKDLEELSVDRQLASRVME